MDERREIFDVRTAKIYNRRNLMKAATVRLLLTMAASLGMTAVSGPVEVSAGATTHETTTTEYAGEPTERLVFKDVPVRLVEWTITPDGTMVVPAMELLVGLGYELNWEPEEEKLKASRPAGPTLIFRASNPEAENSECGVV